MDHAIYIEYVHCSTIFNQTLLAWYYEDTIMYSAHSFKSANIPKFSDLREQSDCFSSQPVADWIWSCRTSMTARGCCVWHRAVTSAHYNIPGLPQPAGSHSMFQLVAAHCSASRYGHCPDQQRKCGSRCLYTSGVATWHPWMLTTLYHRHQFHSPT